MMKNEDEFCFIRINEVIKMTSMPKSSIHLEIKAGNFPKPVKLSARSTAWVKSEVTTWMEKKIAERNGKMNEGNIE